MGQGAGSDGWDEAADGEPHRRGDDAPRPPLAPTPVWEDEQDLPELAVPVATPRRSPRDALTAWRAECRGWLAARRRLVSAAGVSLGVHALLASLTFGGLEPGLPGFGFPWERRHERGDGRRQAFGF